ncbi:hypothetical protein ABNY90_00130 [Escherichia coli]|uniref:hypothetical protein n=1 Tax=Escherichia coli TaxID=562 RepID=UPI0032D9C667
MTGSIKQNGDGNDVYANNVHVMRFISPEALIAKASVKPMEIYLGVLGLRSNLNSRY